MANKKEINPKTGKRLQELIKGLKMTQGDFGERIGLGSRQISCIVRGERRLTEDNARRIAELFPPVRMEWLMGWDDFKTETEQIEDEIYRQGDILQKENNEWRWRDEVVSKILRAQQYRWFKPNTSREALRLEEETDAFMEFFWTLHDPEPSQTMKKSFSEKGLQEMRSLCDRLIRENDPAFMDIFGDDCDDDDDDEAPNHWVAAHPEEFLESIKKWARQEQEEREITSWGLYDNDMNMITVFSPNEYIAFVNQLYDVVTALIQYHITKKKGQP